MNNQNIDVIRAWKDPEYRAELKSKGHSFKESPVENNLDLSLIKGGVKSDGYVHTISGECSPMDHEHDCTSFEGATGWMLDMVYSAAGVC